jgi:hypothetical protein
MGRKPQGHKAMTEREKTQAKLARQWERINTLQDTEWTDRECLLVLTTTRYPHGSAVDKGAWEQLGKLRGFIES